eukprot:m.164753 g.164753  ORF g.164753 m.164753 type:complete len:73 (+) comp38886_c2_seq13:3517-3735(+)
MQKHTLHGLSTLACYKNDLAGKRGGGHHEDYYPGNQQVHSVDLLYCNGRCQLCARTLTFNYIIQCLFHPLWV